MDIKTTETAKKVVEKTTSKSYKLLMFTKEALKALGKKAALEITVVAAAINVLFSNAKAIQISSISALANGALIMIAVACVKHYISTKKSDAEKEE